MSYNNRGGDHEFRFNRTKRTQRILETWYERIDEIRQTRKPKAIRLEERVVIWTAPKVKAPEKL